MHLFPDLIFIYLFELVIYYYSQSRRRVAALCLDAASLLYVSTWRRASQSQRGIEVLCLYAASWLSIAMRHRGSLSRRGVAVQTRQGISLCLMKSI
jgi:hypothetical protein